MLKLDFVILQGLKKVFEIQQPDTFWHKIKCNPNFFVHNLCNIF